MPSLLCGVTNLRYNTENNDAPSFSALFRCILWQCLLKCHVQKNCPLFHLFFSFPLDISHSWIVEGDKLGAPHACDGGESKKDSCCCLSVCLGETAPRPVHTRGPGQEGSRDTADRQGPRSHLAV